MSEEMTKFEDGAKNINDLMADGWNFTIDLPADFFEQGKALVGTFMGEGPEIVLEANEFREETRKLKSWLVKVSQTTVRFPGASQLDRKLATGKIGDGVYIQYRGEVKLSNGHRMKDWNVGWKTQCLS